MGDFLEKILKAYSVFILNTNPTKLWKRIRFVLHWLSLPIKLLLIGGLGLFQIILKTTSTPRKISIKNVSLETKQNFFRKAFICMPILRTTELQGYVPRVSLYEVPNGYNHVSDHQCSRHSTYEFLLRKLGINEEKVSKVTNMFMQNKWLCRGFKWNPYDRAIKYNVSTTSGDMLCGLNLALLDRNLPCENFDILVSNIIENDYALLEGASPDVEDYAYDLYQSELKKNSYREESVKLKSARGMWQPGLETVGAQALTILSTLRLCEVKNGNREAGKEYRKLLYKYGYGLLSIFPTAYTDKQRGYFNDHNCMISLYVLSKCSKTRLGKLFWKIPMVYVWLLSRHWYNGYFTGLLKDCYPNFVSKSYIDQCINYLYEESPNEFVCEEKTEELTKDTPVPYNLNVHDEFSPDTRYDKRIKDSNANGNKFKTGLGFIACAIMLEDNPKELIGAIR